MAETIFERFASICFVQDEDSGEVLNVKPECRKSSSFRPLGFITDPVLEEGVRIRDKTEAELERIPDNIDKATEKVKENIQSVLGGIFDIIPGSGALKLIGIGIAALIGLSIFRRVTK